MQNYTSTETVELKAGSSGSASVLFIMSILGLACAAFTLAMPGAGDQLMADACSALSCEASSTHEVAFHFSNTIEPATAGFQVLPAKAIQGSTHGTAKDAGIPAEVAMTAADQQWQVAQSFNAESDRSNSQPKLIVSAPLQQDTPLAYLADAVPAMH